ncbi:response regulator [Streptomyces sp. NBC_00879]|uniref:response regulator n=1 Tax=Streptomyces sp. NBC_00879 TaxID=2975855 RepID=UPI00386AA6EB|nr:response regulator [Streptomyces sp. NBC_00879]
MTRQLDNVRILVADDQGDVARTLCRPLHKAGARLRFAPDGQAALQEVAARPFDLILIDMKMPPDEWGGLWLLQQLQNGGWRIPSLVLSGEGSKQQVIEALRLEAADWVVKDDAGSELLERCVRILTDRLDESLDLASNILPTPLAHRFAKYTRTTDPDKRVAEGLHTLESVFRFAAVLGMSSTPPSPLGGVTPDRLAAPSMGTWFSVCTALASIPGAGDDFTRMFSWLAPERSDHQSVQAFISVRNALAHGRSAPTPDQAMRIDILLRRFAHRAVSSWRSELAIPMSMTFDGAQYAVDLMNLRGVGKPVPSRLLTQVPVITGQAFLVSNHAAPLPLSPWLLTHMEPASGLVRCLQFDGLQRTRGGLTPDTPFKYAQMDEGEEAPTVSHPQATWQTVAQWFTA